MKSRFINAAQIIAIIALSPRLIIIWVRFNVPKTNGTFLNVSLKKKIKNNTG